MNTDNLTAADLRRAADLRDQIDAAQSELDSLLTGKAIRRKPARKPRRKPGRKKPGPKPGAKKKKAKKKAKSKMSAAGRARISAAQKKRWAKIKAARKASG